MNRHEYIERLAGILSWTGFLLSLPIFGWLIGGTLDQARNLGRTGKRPSGGKPCVSTGRLPQQGVSHTMALTASATFPWLAPHAAADSAAHPHGARLR